MSFSELDFGCEVEGFEGEKKKDFRMKKTEGRLVELFCRCGVRYFS